MRCDPILHAGFLACPCGAASFAVDAAWLGDDLLVARYEPGCAHVCEHQLVRLVRPSELAPAPHAEAEAP